MPQVHAQQVSPEAIPILPLQGGKFGHGFLSAGFAKAVTTYLPFDKLGLDGIGDKYDGWEYVAGRTTVAAISGGTASVIGGGKFENGAKTAALAHLLNKEATRMDVWNRRAMRGTVRIKKVVGQPYQGVYDRTEWAKHTSLDFTDFSPTKKVTALFKILTARYTETRVVTIGDIQDKVIYEYDTVFDLQNGEVVNEGILWRTERYIDTVRVQLNNNVTTIIESRDCFVILGC